mmetsp:Transcript_8128/g.17668  ORF Transcript_8128/g.17668 Transcript_8128/m.17668 type:complete len:238 (+) Transcript_8128:521-1234(+)
MPTITMMLAGIPPWAIRPSNARIGLKRTTRVRWSMKAGAQEESSVSMPMDQRRRCITRRSTRPRLATVAARVMGSTAPLRRDLRTLRDVIGGLCVPSTTVEQSRDQLVEAVRVLRWSASNRQGCSICSPDSCSPHSNQEDRGTTMIAEWSGGVLPRPLPWTPAEHTGAWTIAQTLVWGEQLPLMFYSRRKQLRASPRTMRSVHREVCSSVSPSRTGALLTLSPLGLDTEAACRIRCT